MSSTLHWTTLITTADYTCGVVCLARSLLMVGSRADLVCYVTNPALRETVQATPDFPSNLIVEIIPDILYDGVFSADLSRDHSQFIDAPRRFLFLQGKPFVFLDADMIVTQNVDDLLDMCVVSGAQDVAIIAVPNFRNKKKGYGDEIGNFNAGMMVVPNPQLADYNEMIRILSVGYNDTEEKLLNEVFRGRWRALPIGYNCQKRAFKFAPEVWSSVVRSPAGVKVVHYVGGKPWQSKEELRRLDWEASVEGAMEPYQPLFDLWHKVNRCEFASAADLAAAVPLAVVSLLRLIL